MKSKGKTSVLCEKKTQRRHQKEDARLANESREAIFGLKHSFAELFPFLIVCGLLLFAAFKYSQR